MSKYIGSRIVPKHCGTWSKTKDYEVLSLVLYSITGDSYISRKAVPAGTDIKDEEYWALSSEFSAQLKTVQDDVSSLQNKADTLAEQIAANVAASTDSDADYAAEVVDARVTADGKEKTSLGEAIRVVGSEVADARVGIGKAEYGTLGTAMESFSSPFVFLERVAITNNNVVLKGKGDYTNASYENIKDGNGVIRAVKFTAEIVLDYDTSSIMTHTYIPIDTFKEKFYGNTLRLQLFSPVEGYMNFSIGSDSSGGEGDLDDTAGSTVDSSGELHLNSISYNLYVNEGYNELQFNLSEGLEQVQVMMATAEENSWSRITLSMIPFAWRSATCVPETGKTYDFYLAVCFENNEDQISNVFSAPVAASTFRAKYAANAEEAAHANNADSATNAEKATHAETADTAALADKAAQSNVSPTAGVSPIGMDSEPYSTHTGLVAAVADDGSEVTVTFGNDCYLTTGQGFSVAIGTVADFIGKKIFIHREEQEGYEFAYVAVNFGAKYGNNSYVHIDGILSEYADNIYAFDFDSAMAKADASGKSYDEDTAVWIMIFGNSTWDCTVLEDGETITNTYRFFAEVDDSFVYSKELIKKNAALEEEIETLTATCDELSERCESLEDQLNTYGGGNVLWGKKWFATGDSFTSGGSVEDDKYFTDGPYAGKLKTYPLFIGIRNNMDVTNDAISGSIMALSKEYLAYAEDPENNDEYAISYKSPFSYTRYLAIPEDVDYITLWFGINDSGHTNLGTIDDTTNETFYGAWNVVMEWILTNRPWAHVGIIITNGASTSYRNAEREIAQKWGIPYLDMMGDDQTPVMTLGRESSLGLCTTAYNLRRSTFSVGKTASGDSHPCWQAHEYESTFIEAFLRRL